MLDHPALKRLACDIGRPIKHLVALAEANDPFLADRPGRRDKAEWFASLWDHFAFPQGTHLRHIHYRLVSQPAPFRKPDGSPYENIDNDWALLVNASRDARYLKLVDADTFVDRRNPDPMIFLSPDTGASSIDIDSTDTDIPDWLRDFPTLPNYWLRDFGHDQEFMVEVWIEKSGENDWLVPLCRRRSWQSSRLQC